MPELKSCSFFKLHSRVLWCRMTVNLGQEFTKKKKNTGEVQRCYSHFISLNVHFSSKLFDMAALFVYY